MSEEKSFPILGMSTDFIVPIFSVWTIPKKSDPFSDSIEIIDGNEFNSVP